jgi:hypothetical protein
MLEKNKKYFDRVLSKLKLAFSESEVVKLLTKKLSETETELGIVISERDELQHNLTLAEKEVKRYRNIEKIYEETIMDSKKTANENRALKLELEEKKSGNT